MGAYAKRIESERIGMTIEQVRTAKNTQKRMRGEERRNSRKSAAVARYMEAGVSGDKKARIALTQGLEFPS